MFDYFRGQTQPVGDGQGIAAAGQPQSYPVSGFQRARFQVHAGVNHPRLFLHVAGHAPVVSGGDGQDAVLTEVSQNGLSQGRAFLRVGAGAQFVNQHQGIGGDLLQNRPQVLDVRAEGGQGLLDALLVADVGVDTVQQGEFGLFGGYVQPGMGHQRQQADRFEGYRLAPGVGAGDDHYPVFPAQLQVYRHHPLGEQGMPRSGQAEAARRGAVRMGVRAVRSYIRRVHIVGVRIGWVDDDGSGGAAVNGVTALGHCQVQTGQQVQGQLQVVARLSHLGGQGAQDPFLLPLLGQAGFAPVVARFNRRQRLDKHGRPAVGNVMDDAGSLGLELGLNQQDQAAVALGNNRLLHHFPALVAA